jgi:NADPH-dependent 2,4-dienoyl-CoA reductase/sulfur reductase-like enzyme
MSRLVCVGGSDAGIAAALRARELDPAVEVTVVLADDYPNFSVCGLPYYLSGEVADWRDLAHRRRADLEAQGIEVRSRTQARRVAVADHCLEVVGPSGREDVLAYDRLVLATGARPCRPPVPGLERLGPEQGVHLLHDIGEGRRIMADLEGRRPRRALVVGAGFIGLEMAEALRRRQLAVTVLEARPQVLPALDLELGALVAETLRAEGVDVRTGCRLGGLAEEGGELRVEVLEDAGGTRRQWRATADLVLVATGVAPDAELARSAGATLARNGAVRVDRRMATGLPDVFAAGDCVVTHHRLLGETYLPLGTTAHKQGRVAGENAAGGDRRFAGSLGTQVVKVFDLVAARTGLRDSEATAAGLVPWTWAGSADDHKAYYPGASPIHLRLTADRRDGRLLGTQMVGSRPSAVHKRIDTAATAIHAGMRVDELSDLDLSYTPPLGSPWDVLQVAGQGWSATVSQ